MRTIPLTEIPRYSSFADYEARLRNPVGVTVPQGFYRFTPTRERRHLRVPLKRLVVEQPHFDVAQWLKGLANTVRTWWK